MKPLLVLPLVQILNFVEFPDIRFAFLLHCHEHLLALVIKAVNASLVERVHELMEHTAHTFLL